jgi:hypothetical protein
MLTTDPKDPRLNETKSGGQQEAYLVLSEEERAKGFVRPVRDSYKHWGQMAKYPLRDLTDDEHKRYDQYGYVQFEAYPEGSALLGRYWTEQDLKGGCQQITTMARPLAETYARDPKFYGSTYCSCCGKHFPVGQFRWLDDSLVGS